MSKLSELIWYELGDGLNATDVNEACLGIAQLLVDSIPAKKEKSSEGYPNTKELEAWKDGYNKCRSDMKMAINSLNSDPTQS